MSTPATVTQLDMECEEIREELNSESVSKSSSQTGSEGVTGEVNDISIPNFVGSTLQPSSKSPTFKHQISNNEIFSTKLNEIDKEISKFDSQSIWNLVRPINVVLQHLHTLHLT